jgi:hypothetical protein
MQQVIYLEGDDDMPAVRHLLEGTQGKQVLLVLPKGYQLFREPLNLRVLRRYAADLALDVALVTRDSRTRQVAREEGVATVSSVRVGRRGRWRGRAPLRSPAERAAAARVSGLRAGHGDTGYGDTAIVWAGRIAGVLLFALLLLLIVGMAALLVPEAKLTLVPYRQPVDATLRLRADPSVERANTAELTIPARLVEAQAEQTGEIATMSKRDAPDAPATGTLTFINQTVVPHEILTDTIVRTSTGTTVRFKTVTTATLEAGVGARAEVAVEALEPGPVGNVAAATINEVETTGLRGKVSVINPSPTVGGGVKQVGVVTRVDMDRLKEQVFEQLKQQAYLELQAQLEEQEFLPPESLTFEILSEVYDQFLDAEADALHLQMRILASGTAVDRANANLLAYEALQEKIPATYELESEEVTFDLSEDVQMDGRVATMEVTAMAQLVADIDRGAARAAVAGLPEEEAVEILAQSFALAELPRVEVVPEWVKRWEWLDRVPFPTFRIQVIVLE